MIPNPRFDPGTLQGDKEQPKTAKAFMQSASSRMGLGKDLEKTGPEAATAVYQSIIRDFPKSKEASEAAERIQAIEPILAQEAQLAKAERLMVLGRNLEKAKKPSASLPYYRQVVKEYPDTPQAKEAAARIKALEPPAAK
jgi:TolA-binding protein